MDHAIQRCIDICTIDRWCESDTGINAVRLYGSTLATEWSATDA